MRRELQARLAALGAAAFAVLTLAGPTPYLYRPVTQQLQRTRPPAIPENRMIVETLRALSSQISTVPLSPEERLVVEAAADTITQVRLSAMRRQKRAGEVPHADVADPPGAARSEGGEISDYELECSMMKDRRRRFAELFGPSLRAGPRQRAAGEGGLHD